MAAHVIFLGLPQQNTICWWLKVTEMYCLTGLEAGGGPWENAQNMNCEINPSWVGRELGYLSTNSQESLLQGCSLGLSPLRQRDAGAGTC